MRANFSDVGFALEQYVERVTHHAFVKRWRVQQQQRARPVHRLSHRGRLADVGVAHALHKGHQLHQELLGHFGHARAQHAALQRGVGVTDVQVQATPLQCIPQLASVVRREDDQRRHLGANGADLGDGDLVVRQHFQQQGFKSLLGLVHFVDQQHAATALFHGVQQRTGL